MLTRKTQQPTHAEMINPQRKPSRTPLLIGATLFVLGAFLVLHILSTGQLPFLHRESVWSVAIYEGDSPFALKPVSPGNVPALTADDVTDVSALFVADPFMIQDGEEWFMFLEVLNRSSGQGDIGLATSQDGVKWKYDQLVLDETFHLSYPSVFRWQETWYMLPESSETNSVRLYETNDFPKQWKFRKTLFSAERVADPTLFRDQGVWWMFLGVAGKHDTLRLLFADELLGNWTEHPHSPLIVGDPEIARPGGSVVRYGKELYRLGQDCSPKYGNQLRAFRITKLSKTEYAEEAVPQNPVLQAGTDSWNACGMHHSNSHPLSNGRWRAAVDGHRKTWSLRVTP